MDKPVIDEFEFNRLLTKCLEREHTKLSKRSEPRVERPIDIKPTTAGGRIVDWKRYLELVEKGEAQYPPKPYGARH